MRLLLIALLLHGMLPAQDRQLLRIVRSEVTFLSEAPMEDITATNLKSSGVITRESRSFAVQIPIADFVGFNSPLQREHFNENYMNTKEHPHATFQGRVIEAIDLVETGTHEVRAKGVLSLRGVEQERIIPCRIVVGAEGVRVISSFDVALADHGIRIPRVVQQKIAAVVNVKVDALFKPEEERK